MKPQQENSDLNQDLIINWLPVPDDRKDEAKHVKEILGSTILFESLSRKDWNTVLRLLHIRHFKENEVIFEAGTPGLGMYVILEGEVTIIERQPEEDNVLAVLKEGSFLGELSLIDDLNRSATAIATKPTKLVGFFRPQLLQLIHQRPKLGVKLLERLAKIVFQRLRISNEKLRELRESMQVEAN